MLAKYKLILASMLIVSMLGLGIISIVSGDWKAFVLGVLYSIANVVIFIL